MIASGGMPALSDKDWQIWAERSARPASQFVKRVGLTPNLKASRFSERT
jgi:hypothetical protein